jgi:diguanylate cyclase (GGDEF)-like protein
MRSTNQILADNVRLLRARVSGYAVAGVLIACGAIVVATVLVTLFETGGFSLHGMMAAQRSNFALWALDLTPFVFGVWGQVMSSIMAYEAGAMVVDQTSEIRAQTAALELQALHGSTHDRLTELPNRALLHDRLHQAIVVARRDRARAALLVLDIDGFKEINNTLGHFSGDLLLKRVAGRLRGSVREPDTVARLGGDQFAVLLPHIRSAADARTVAEKLFKALEPSFALEKLNVDLLASIGIALYPDHGDDADALLQKADVAMYAAKQTSGFSVATYSPKHDQYSPHRLTLAGELRKAIDGGQLVVYYQPKVDMASSTLTGAEALVRRPHPDHGLLPPDEFIPLAERTGLIRPLTRWVLSQALQQCAQWRQDGLDLQVAVNVSAKVLLDPELPDMLAGLLASSQVTQGSLILEITESTLMADQERAHEILSRLGQLGVQLSIDDFGTGYSSLAYLRRLPIHEIKVDKSFVMGMVQNDNDTVIVRATIALAHNLGMSVTAEGVCDARVWAKLAGEECDQAQGDHISRAVSAEALARWMATSPWHLPGRSAVASSATGGLREAGGGPPI